MSKTAALVLAVLAFGCAGDAVDPATCEQLLIVVIGAQVSPEGDLERFEVHEPTNCEGQPTDYQLSRAWKVSACMYQALNRIDPTYEAGAEPKLMYWPAIYDLRMPHRFLPRRGAGSSPDNPVVNIQDELPAQVESTTPDHICAGSFDVHAV